MDEPVQAPGAALARWRAVTWPAVIAEAALEGRRLPAGTRWAMCRGCDRDPADLACCGCTIVLEPEPVGSTLTGYRAGAPTELVVSRRKRRAGRSRLKRHAGAVSEGG